MPPEVIVSYDTIKAMRPPFQLTPKILTLVSEISLLLGRYEGIHAPAPQPKLRRQNRIKTIQSSLAIEGNTLDLSQVTAIFENKRVLGPQKDILEVRNAIELYERLHEFNPNSLKDLLKAHSILMKGLAEDAGRLRAGAVGILKGSKVSHIAPPAKQLPKLVDDLIAYIKKEKDLSPLVIASVFHYELEFIHPFSDGNGRMGRFWQTLILSKFNPIFAYIPIESIIKQRQQAYYEVLEQSDKKGDSTSFIEFSLETIRDALKDFLDDLKPEPATPEVRLNIAKNEFKQREFSRKDYLKLLKTVSTATASRDLILGVKLNILEKFGTKAVARYRFKRTAK